MTPSVFLSYARLEALVDSSGATLEGARLVLNSATASYRIEEAVLIRKEVSGAADPKKLVGTVRTRKDVAEGLGGEILGSSLLVDDSAYEVQLGVLAVRDGSFDAGPSGRGERATWQSLDTSSRLV